MIRPFVLFVICSVSLFAQRPVIDPDGVRNAASYTPGIRGLVTIFGSNLAISTETAATTPLPTTLGGTRVTFGGQAAFLPYVSPKQINLQVPFTQNDGVVVTTAVGSSEEYTLDNNNYSQVGLFIADSSGCGQAAALNVSAATICGVNQEGLKLDVGQTARLDFILRSEMLAHSSLTVP